jgi:long-chain acyl-CoA synthetase
VTPRTAGGSGIATVPPTIAALPFFAAGRFPKPDLVGRASASGVARMSGRELLDHVRDLSLGLASLGVAPGDRVAVLSESRPEWLIADFAILAAGAVTTPIYPTLSAEQVGFILRDSRATLAIVSTADQAAKLLSAIEPDSSLQTIVVMERGIDAPLRALTWAEVMQAGHRRILDGWGVARAFQDQALSVKPDDVATIVYTSGTTGAPKGVMLTHANLAANVAGVISVLELSEDDTALSFLPLCHAFERIVSYVYFATGVSMIFAESIDTVARDLLQVRPTVMTGVPRVFEKLYARIVEKGRAAPPVKRRLFEWAMRVASERGRVLSGGRRPGLRLALASRLADRLAFTRLREAIGGRMRYAVSGSAPLNPDLARFFFGIGFPILEGYGLTETSPVISVMRLRRERFGTVGEPLPNVEVRLADDGDVLVRGANVMAGYFGRPDDTAAVMRDGWFHTGDIGELDADGYLRITDRKKEVILTSGGKKIAPQPIEERLRAHRLVNEAVLIGEGRHFPAALLVPDFAALAALLQIDPAAVRTRLNAPDVRQLFQRIVDGVNVHLAQFERIKQFRLLDEEFSLQTGELTPTLKVKRRVIEQKYRSYIDDIYSQPVSSSLRTSGPG